ncbi:acyltransferase family protein [Weissella koreensis]|uniref:Acyltransferase n=1 Tax=Weissella koreensis TaxID=165096 RepID=A0A7H1MKR9_9LACO|nr:acyltransferase family protein [Weissella koreensis]AVH74852.1 acyltransferase [Weissella koreensis]EJF33810.1 hypothetical protein JC2156_06240 [Weissella koreensis KCTC 3621]QGN20076.1 acyltransferase family protein [Weissella koreensis]QNT64055.1 acyltransferase [Weissella koreensis]
MKRIEWIDIAKGQTIFLVVLVHVLEGIYKTNLFPEAKLGLECSMSGIFLIIMPIFLALSGYLYKVPQNRKYFIDQFKKKAWNLLWPSIIFSVIYVGLQQCAGGDVHEGHQWSSLLTMGITPIGYLWFLETLFLTWLLMSALFSLKINIWFQALIYVGLVFVGWHVQGPLILQDVCVWSIFFFLGYLIKNNSKIMLQSGVVIGSLIVLLMTLYAQSQIPTEWYDTNGPTPLIMLGKLASVIVAFKFFQVLHLKRTKMYWLNAGKNSLIIYLVHAPLASILRILLLKLGINNFYLLTFLILIFTWELSRWVAWISLRYRPLQIIFYPTRWWSDRTKERS